MTLLLNWRVWVFAILVAAFAFTNFASYRKGKADDHAAWIASVAASNAEALRLERARQSNVDESVRSAAAREVSRVADAARADRTISGLRATLDATQQHAAESLAAATQTVAAYRAVFESCVAEYRAMGAEAQGHADDSLMYQEAWPK